jgi:hypothetical protein
MTMNKPWLTNSAGFFVQLVGIALGFDGAVAWADGAEAFGCGLAIVAGFALLWLGQKIG